MWLRTTKWKVERNKSGGTKKTIASSHPGLHRITGGTSQTKLEQKCKDSIR